MKLLSQILMPFLAYGCLPLFLTAAEPPRQIPEEHIRAFTLEGNIPVNYWYRNDSYSSETPRVYTKEQLQEGIAQAKRKETKYYGMTDLYLYNALEKYRTSIEGKEVAVLGSVIPWYESIVLAYGGHPTTIEYNKLVSEDPRLRVMTVQEYAKNPLTFHALLSISSFEHDGLGRYGDPINPNGDLEAMEKAKHMLNEGGLLFLAVPVGRDYLTWNVHRTYGELRLNLLLKGWDVVDSFGFDPTDLRKNFALQWFQHQPVFVLRPIR